MRQPHRLRRRSADFAARNARAALGAVALLLAQPALAQSKDVPPPPLLDPAPTVFTITPKELANKPPDPAKLTAVQLAATQAPARPPNAAMLAPPTPGRGTTTTPIDEIVVIGTSSHLPDLGGRWRARQRLPRSGKCELVPITRISSIGVVVIPRPSGGGASVAAFGGRAGAEVDAS